MNKPKVLIVEDDATVRELMQVYLGDDFELVLAADGVTAVEKARQEKPTVILLDIMLPQRNGWEVCQEIRGFSKAPIIIVSAKGEESDKIQGLELGADDYLTKPFSPRELYARVKAQVRRNSYHAEEIERSREAEPEGQPKSNDADWLRLNNLRIDLKGRRIFIGDHELELTSKEYELMLFLAQNSGQVFKREQLLERVWGFDYEGEDRAVDSIIKRLRKKLALHQADYINTVWGVGYKLEVPPG